MIIGLVSDTHGFFDPRLPQILAGSELILHAGDVGPEEILDQLRRIAPVHAVRGNVDSPDAGWPLSLTLSPGGLVTQVLHILPAPQSDLETWAESARISRHLPKGAGRLLGSFDSSVEMVVFGHSHQPCLVSMGDVLWVNPGSAGRKRFRLPRTCALIELSNEEMKARIVPLEPDDGSLPRRVQVKLHARLQA
ncbi:MAG TPA: metallophosphoesterase family protein [Terriglobia bacterium]